MVERAATQASDFGPEISDSVFWFATKVRSLGLGLWGVPKP